MSKRQVAPPSLESPVITFDQLVLETIFRLKTRSASVVSVQSEFSTRTSINGKLELNAVEWDLLSGTHPVAHLRMVHIRGPKNAIINTWIFPNRPERMPVFAAELIAVGSETRVAFVDIQVPALSDKISEEVAVLTSALKPRFAILQCAEKPPEWATHASPGEFVYARNVPADRFSTVEECYLTYLNTYLEAFTSPANAGSADTSTRNEETVDLLHSYQEHHMVHSPGNLFLSKLFGSEWTEAFMREFLFAKPRG